MVITLRGGGMGVNTCKTNDKQFLIYVLNLRREYSQGNQIKTYLFERLKRENIAACINQTKAELSGLADANQLRLSCGLIFYKFYPWGIYKCTNNEFEFLKFAKYTAD